MMKKVVTLIAWMAMILLPLTVFAATSQPNPMDTRATWYGGPAGHISSKVESATLADITSRAVQEAVDDKLPVEYKTADGSMMYQAYPDYGKSKCGFVHGKAWEDGKLVESRIIEVCNRNYEEPAPYAPRVPTVVFSGVR